MEPTRVLLTRSGIVECDHRVRVAVWREGRLVASAGDVDTPVFLRSSAKPIQALAAVLTGAADRFSMTDAELALACGSHGGEPFHVETAGGLLRRIGLGPEHLLCGAHPPLHEPSARALVASGVEPTTLHNNCSGKHSAMLAACVAAGWEVREYVDPAHPLQQLNLRNVAAMAGISLDQVRLGVDGCSALVFALPMAAMARLFAGLANRNQAPVSEELRVASRRITAAMRAHPEMVGGTGRIDSDLIRATGGRVICKVGAEGLWCIGVEGRDLGIAVKSEDGSPRPAHLVGLSVLRALGAITESEWPRLSVHSDTERRNHRRLLVGSFEITPPTGIAL